MNRTFKKLICFILAVVASITTVFVIPASATSDSVVDRIILNRIDELERAFADEYFTVSHNGCYSYYESNHGCSNCYSGSIVKENWFINKTNRLSWLDSFDFDKVKPDTFYGNGCSYYANGFSCHAFSSIMFSLMFFNENRIDVYNVGTFDFSYESIKSIAKPGDFVRLNTTHSAIVISVHPNKGLEVLDCNSKHEFNCFVTRRFIPFSYYTTATFTRASNREKIHICTYNNEGKCSCGEIYNFNASKDEYSYTGEYKLKLFSSGTSIRTAPYSAAPAVKSSGSRVRIVYSVKNHFNNTWLAVEYEGSTYCAIGYVHLETFLKKYTLIKGTSSTPSTSNNSKPAITSGSGYRISGKSEMRLSWNSNNCSSFEVAYLSRDGVTYISDVDYTNPSSSSFTSRDIVRSMTYRIIGISPSGERSKPYYIKVSY